MDLARAPRRRLLQISSTYLEKGGEEAWLGAMNQALEGVVDLHHCSFSSHDWVGPSAPSKIKQARLMLSNPASLRLLRRVHDQARPDAWVVHNVFPVGSAAIYREASRLKVPVIQYVHNYRPFSINGYLWAGGRLTTGGLARRYFQEIRHAAWQDSRLKTAWFGAVLEVSRRLGWWGSIRARIAISEFVRQKLLEFGVPKDSVHTIRYFFSARSTPPSYSVGSHYLFLGRLIEAKGVSILFRAWKILEQRLGKDCPPLVIAGAGPLEDFVRREANAMSSVRYVGQLAGVEKEAALAEARAVVVPSRWWEPLGLVVYEAYDAAKPVLAAASGGLTETVLDGVTGLRHSPDDADQLASNVLSLEEDEARRRQMGEAGRRWLLAHASEAEWRAKFLDVVEQVIASHSG